jgi:outer membrane protein, heavy metal efflux system
MTLIYYARFTLFLSVCLMAASAQAMELNEAVQRALAYSPILSIANTEIDVKQAEQYQAGLLPNPEFSIEIDGANQFVGSRRRGSVDDREITYSLSQLIELGGKRATRKQIAAFETSLAAYEKDLVKLDVVNSVTKAIVDVRAAQEYLKLAEEQLKLAVEVREATSAKVQGGKISSLQEKKADLARMSADLTAEKAKRALELSKKKLAALWGSRCPDFSEVEFPLFDVQPIDALSDLLAQQNSGLTATQWEMQIAWAREIILGEKAQAIPDVVVTAGYFAEKGDSGLTLGFLMPIPIFDRNQGNISRAKHELTQIYEKKDENMLELKTDLEDAYDQLVTAYRQSLSFKESILSSAKAAFEAAREEYANGKNDYLELLDAQRTLFDVQEQYINTLVDYHQRKADVKRLVGLPLEIGSNCQNF